MRVTRGRTLIVGAALAGLGTVLMLSFQLLRPAEGYRRVIADYLQAYPNHVDQINPGTEFVADFYGLKWEGNTTNFIDAHVILYGAYEKHILYFLRDTVRAMGHEQTIFWDVGAHAGQHSLFMSQHAWRVHAFEPNPLILKRLHRAISTNGVSNVVVHEVGLGAEGSTIEFYDTPEVHHADHTTGSFVEGFHPHNSTQTKTRLPIVSSDEYMGDIGFREVHLIKIDVEGYEKEVLEGMRRTLESNRPVVEMELTIIPGQDRMFTSWEELASAFPAGYEFMMFQTYDRRVGSYELDTLRVDFGRDDQLQLVAFPAEESASLPRSSFGDRDEE